MTEQEIEWDLLHYKWEQYGGRCDFTLNDFLSVYNLLRKFTTAEPLIIADLGCREGSSTSILASYLKERKHGKVHAIDWYKTNVQYKDMFNKHMKNLKLDDYIIQYHMSNTEAYHMFKSQNQLFDFIFIDASHAYKKVKEDIDLWWNLLKPSGIISGHDCEFKIDANYNLDLTQNKYASEFSKGILNNRLYTRLGEYDVIDNKIKITQNQNWDKVDGLGFYYDKDNDLRGLGIHPGAIVAISEKFPNVAIEGDRIWWTQKS
jgi:predicted O-methyltransferase YrrM